METAGSYLNIRTLIIGDVKSGKTALTSQVLQAFIRAGYAAQIAILDLAPEPVGAIGGKMKPPTEPGLIYLSAPIAAPRLTGTNELQILQLAQQNARAIEALFVKIHRRPKDILFVNDASLYLQAGNLDTFVKALDTASTRIINAYYGKTFEDSALTRREKLLTEKLMKTCDTIKYLE
ncbi:hypothetical protein ACFL0M_07335 [Thermodesulfobacteriota bacterium]